MRLRQVSSPTGGICTSSTSGRHSRIAVSAASLSPPARPADQRAEASARAQPSAPARWYAANSTRRSVTPNDHCCACLYSIPHRSRFPGIARACTAREPVSESQCLLNRADPADHEDTYVCTNACSRTASCIRDPIRGRLNSTTPAPPANRLARATFVFRQLLRRLVNCPYAGSERLPLFYGEGSDQ
jgi:hypothetical protein